jgi:hypothetical protein
VTWGVPTPHQVVDPGFCNQHSMLDSNAKPLAISLLPRSSSAPRFKDVVLAGAFFLILCVLLLGAVVNRQPQAQAETSKLWGKAGELWTPQSRLPDFSFAGYHCGEVPLPDVPVVNSVARFGAKGDGITDDTAAFLKAIEETSNGALFIPEGRYVLTGVLTINKSNLVLRGAGPEKTVFVIPKSLTQVSEPTKGPLFPLVAALSRLKARRWAKSWQRSLLRRSAATGSSSFQPLCH